MNFNQESLWIVTRLHLPIKTALLVIACISVLSSCAQTSPYVTKCNQPACDMVATQTSNIYQEIEGIKVLASPAIEFTINNNAIEKMSEQGNIFSVKFKNKKSISTATLSLESLGIEKENVDIDKFIESVFLNKFNRLKDQNLSDVLLHSAWGLKTVGIENSQVFYFSRKPLTVFYYSSKPSSAFPGKWYQILVLDERDKKQATMIDLHQFNDAGLEKFLSTIKSYDY